MILKNFNDGTIIYFSVNALSMSECKDIKKNEENRILEKKVKNGNKWRAQNDEST